MHGPLVPVLLGGNDFSPYRLANNAAIYSLDGPESASTYLTNGSGRVTLVADRSGNSAVNGLALPGSSGNYASIPDASYLDITADIAITANFSKPNIATDGTFLHLASKSSGGAPQRSWVFRTNGGGLSLVFAWTEDGANFLISTSSAFPFANFVPAYVGVSLDVDNGAGGNDTKFWTSVDGVTWQQFGATITKVGTTSIASTTSSVLIGGLTSVSELASGIVSSVTIYNGIPSMLSGGGGTVAVSPNFTLAAKLAASFTESSSNAATVTINTSGDTGARISGARDLYQATATKMPALSVGADGRNVATFDGSNDYMKAAAFSLSQPESAYFVGSQVTWTDADYVYDGASVDSMALLQTTNGGGASPRVKQYAGSYGGNVDTWPVATRAVIRAVYNGASSTLGVNRAASVAGASTGNANGGGFTVGAHAAGGQAGNVALLDVLIRNVADPDPLQLQIAGFYIRKAGIAA